MVLEVKTYDVGHEREWNAFVLASNEGTMFHRLDFLGYHGSRFEAHEQHVAWYKGSTLYGVMPLAIFQEEAGSVAKSPYGASYGGPVFPKALGYSENQEAVAALLTYLRQASLHSCRITLPIQACYRSYSETFRLALLEQGFRCVNRDISSVVPLGQGGTALDIMSSRARNSARKAQKIGVQVVHEGNLDDFMMLLHKTYERLDAHPTHTSDELRWLRDHMGGEVQVEVAYHDSFPIAGACLFVMNNRVNSSFYLCQDPEKRDLQGLTLLVQETLERSKTQGYVWFDFGTSSAAQQGRANLFQFKESFGAIGQFRETYVWENA